MTRRQHRIVTTFICLIDCLEIACNTADNSGQFRIDPVNKAKPNPTGKERIHDGFIPGIPRHIKTISVRTVVIFTFGMGQIHVDFRRFVKCGFFKEPDYDICCFTYAVSETKAGTNSIPTLRYKVFIRDKDSLYTIQNSLTDGSQAVSNILCNIANALRNAR